ncbi:hypothetical protein Pcinc_011316 [Petrolisthes cinctipes]|uniref:Uncharacterized protein n=1 Tax=Petrolisthes cinctipes TaxID=88211 RepID=A0AAE1G121_PETCI|nr:hypothetical protein Pcinc_011316 [Petrolisthes cinctipes]
MRARFESDQFEANRQDGWKKLKQNAIPTKFSYHPQPGHRKVPMKELIHEEPLCLKTDMCIGHDHVYVKRSTDGCKMGGQEMGEVKGNNEASKVEAVVNQVIIAGVLTLQQKIHMSMTNQVPPQQVTLEDKSVDTLPPASPTLLKNKDILTAHQIMISTTPVDLHLIKIRKLQAEVEELQSQLQKKEAKNQALIKTMSLLWNPDQISALCRTTTRGKKWSEDTLEKSAELQFTCGSKGYEDLLDLGFPLPSLRTLRRHLEGNFRGAELKDSESCNGNSDRQSAEAQVGEEDVTWSGEEGALGGSRQIDLCQPNCGRIKTKVVGEKISEEMLIYRSRHYHLHCEVDASKINSEKKSTNRAEDMEEREVEQ